MWRPNRYSRLSDFSRCLSSSGKKAKGGTAERSLSDRDALRRGSTSGVRGWRGPTGRPLGASQRSREWSSSFFARVRPFRPSGHRPVGLGRDSQQWGGSGRVDMVPNTWRRRFQQPSRRIPTAIAVDYGLVFGMLGQGVRQPNIGRFRCLHRADDRNRLSQGKPSPSLTIRICDY